MPRATAAEATADPTLHSHATGAGYVKHATPPVPPPTRNKTKAAPPKGTQDGTAHLLKSPCGNATAAFIWQATGQLWRPSAMGGLRLAYSVEYLSGHGWKYLRPVE